MFDLKVGGYLLNSTTNLYSIKDLTETYLNKSFDDYVSGKDEKQEQMTLFSEVEEMDNKENKIDQVSVAKAYFVTKLHEALKKELENHRILELLLNIEMPVM